MAARRISLMLAVLLGGGALWAGESPSGRTIQAGQPSVAVSLFESDAAVRPGAAPKRLVIFDQSKTPSSYSTCYVESADHPTLKILRPYEGAIFPRNIAPPKFRWSDGLSNSWLVSLKVPGWSEPLRVVTGRSEWRPDDATWEAIKSDAEGGEVSLEVRGCRVADGARAGDVYMDAVSFKVSKIPMDPIIVYRMVTPLFHGLKTPDIEYRDVSNFDTKLFLPGKGLYCTNCHSFPVNPETKPEDQKLAIAVRKQLDYKNSLRILGLYDFESKTGKTLDINSFFMSWDPDGKKVAVTGGSKVRVRPLITLETQEFYVQGADILIVDSETFDVRPLPGADRRELMETMPTWSPDGKHITFARSTEMGKQFEERRFDLCRIDYNGGRGETALPIPGASANGASNYAPRYSPDGKWIVFNKADWSSLVAPTSDLWIMPADWSEKPRELDCNVPQAMDSHHSWSSEGRWMLFASKRDDGIFARIYITHIDEAGRASPPVELPTLGKTMHCYNVPEFLNSRLDIDADDILRDTSTLEEKKPEY